MHRRPLLLVLTLVLPLLALVPVTASVADQDPAVVATHDLRHDAEAGLTLSHGDDGQVDFVGTPARGSINNPDVAADDSVRVAARAHLDRYGAALEPATGSTFAQTSTLRTTSGVDVVRYQQSVDGVRVLGGQVVLGLDNDRDLRSMTSTVSGSAVDTATAEVAPTEAAATARSAVSRGHDAASLTVKDLGRWVLDPATAGLDLPGGVRTVRRLEVSDGAAVRDLVLVDDHTGAVVFHTSLIAEADRVVCDRNNQRGNEAPCTASFARTETGPASLVSDVNKAFAFAGETALLYAQFAPPAYQDLTALLGVTTSGGKKLASTVRFCSDAVQGDPATFVDACPYDNAFWNGQQMFYGDGFAAADDVVGHEMTHGYTERTSNLFYWGQPGAINESMSDVIGEIIDHRNGTGTGADDDSAWDLGEDLTSYGPFRRMSDPPFEGDPDSMTSPLYDPDTDASDSGGVHHNSGVGNKTAYLISQGTGGQAVNGQTFTGIDAGDPGLAKTAVLYLEVIPRLVSGSDYADLAATLDQTCQDLLAQGTVRTVTFTADDCATVHQATLATALTSPPTTITKPADASTECPTGTLKRVLFTSEGPNAASAMSPSATSDPSLAWYRDDTSFRSPTWAVADPDVIGDNPLRTASSITLPAGQPSYLSFNGWWVNDYVPTGPDTGDYDGGAVRLTASGLGLVTPGAGAWVNGPNGTITDKYGNPHAGAAAFTADSHGWVGSRLDLTGYAGRSVRPEFTMLSDDIVGSYGWFLDDITVYTCASAYAPPHGLKAAGTLNGMTVSWSAPSRDLDLATSFGARLSTGASWTLPTSARSQRVVGLTAHRRSYTFAVRTQGSELATSPYASLTVPVGIPAFTAKRQGSKVTFAGTVKGLGKPVKAGSVQVQRKVGSRWVVVKRATTASNGTWTAAVVRKPKAVYRAVYLGGPGYVGTTSWTNVRR